jgi:osmotically-inducible protein OsmY
VSSHRHDGNPIHYPSIRQEDDMARAQRRNESDTFNSYRTDADRDRRDWSRDWDREHGREDRDRGFYRFEDHGRGIEDEEWFERDRDRDRNREREWRDFGNRDWRDDRRGYSLDNRDFGRDADRRDRDQEWNVRGHDLGSDRQWRGGEYGGRHRDQDRERGWYAGYAGEGFQDRGDYSPMNRYGQDFGRQSFEGFGQSRNRQFQNQGQFGTAEQFGQGSFQGSRFGQPISRGIEHQDRSFAGVGPRNYKRSDERIKEDVCEMFSANPWLDASNTEIEVKNGIVTLTGTVNDRRTRQLMEDIAEAVPGVKDVECQIKLETKTKAGMMGTSGEKTAEKDKGGNSGTTPDTTRHRQ